MKKAKELSVLCAAERHPLHGDDIVKLEDHERHLENLNKELRLQGRDKQVLLSTFGNGWWARIAGESGRTAQLQQGAYAGLVFPKLYPPANWGNKHLGMGGGPGERVRVEEHAQLQQGAYAGLLLPKLYPPANWGNK
ncbi:unnamed protein product [Sphenostylis stenocarpa]|uniref:Uncharacterized protein n=1 Tax=Sphenostylis stenocarpa TaxID=92480 RepID=A0AA86RM77_9FABA|nr:unnamed protein product [Sphenostylis stenocarpa]